MYLGGHRSTHWSQYGQYHGHKVPNAKQDWKMLVPDLMCPCEEDIKKAEELLRMPITSESLFTEALEDLVPIERWDLL